MTSDIKGADIFGTKLVPKSTAGGLMKLYGQSDSNGASTSDGGVFLSISQLTNGKSLSTLVGKSILIYLDEQNEHYSESHYVTDGFVLSTSSQNVSILGGGNFAIQYTNGKLQIGYNSWQDDPPDLTQPFALYILSSLN